jgi:hypothetical protein
MCGERCVIDGERRPGGQERSIENGGPENDEEDSGNTANHADSKTPVKTNKAYDETLTETI